MVAREETLLRVVVVVAVGTVMVNVSMRWVLGERGGTIARSRMKSTYWRKWREEGLELPHG